MCIVIDTCAWHAVFDSSTKEHEEFKPVLDWVTEGKGKVLYGGKKYKEELERAPKYLRIFSELNKARRVVSLPDANVDARVTEVKKIHPEKAFDDPHIFAIVSIAKCKLLCTLDSRSFKYLKDAGLYRRFDKNCTSPSIYTRKKNSSLLSDKYVAAICKK